MERLHGTGRGPSADCPLRRLATHLVCRLGPVDPCTVPVDRDFVGLGRAGGIRGDSVERPVVRGIEIRRVRWAGDAELHLFFVGRLPARVDGRAGEVERNVVARPRIIPGYG